MKNFKKFLNELSKNQAERNELAKTLQGLFFQTNNPKSISKGPASQFTISPGDILLFTYNKNPSYRMMIVMKIKRGPGKFISTTGKLLIAGFKLNGYVDSTGILLKHLYKNRINSDYWKLKKVFTHLFGLRNFRTYWIKRMRNFKEIHY